MPGEATISYTVKLPARAQKRLFEMAKAQGYQPSLFVQLLFEAAWAARVGVERGDAPADRDLDQMCRAVFCLAGQFDTAAIARATGIAEPLACRILDGWRAEAKPAAAKKRATAEKGAALQ